MPDDIDRMFSRLDRNRFAAGSDPNDVLLTGHMPAMGSIAPAGFVSDLMQDGTGKVSNDGSGIIVKDGSDDERVRLGNLGGGDYGLRVTSSSGTVVIDGTSDIFRIAATGTINIAAGPNGSGGELFKASSVDLATGFTYVPAIITMSEQGVVGTSNPYVLWVQSGGFTDSYGVTDSYEMTNQVVSTNQTRIGARWKTSDLYNRSGLSTRFRYFILEQVAF